MQIKNILKDRILHGQYPLDTNIPPEPRLEEEFGVSKITIRGAIKELVQEGYLEPSSGRGTRVVRNTKAVKRSTRKSFTELLVEEGHAMRKKLLSAAIARHEPETEQRRLHGEAGIKVERLYLLDEAPYIHYAHYLPARLEKADLSALAEQSLYGFLEESGIVLASFRDAFAVSAAPSDVASHLRLTPGAPVLKRLRYAYDEAGAVVEYSEGYYNTALQHYVVNYEA
ncbi:GntR family transcriptional regulator [Cohnella sp. JJ-181]|uniref:GntR family transcriptional regulator n=1 Tax=Cohnella rhizoplanae TaxID=2974897 RepID=UPI00232F7D5E|nr:GntR family transcriptional regulator [Cohnella sp. JJ-181]